ncbi:S1C family serine protease [Aquimarina brevivitae]|uniref:Do/DeqQ family serine protease n=1 Tax=Aquimarina brevivitae TaxID=323412 RepID=A0A4Q7NYX5_9FLAO|nr:trypsin-like peptidase domain-containing protein [Aquimarina brevivitae]RZS92633.1 Do/DeqQ family serine protease [Aquimarina brevivitae]
MKRFLSLLVVAFLAGAITLGAYKLFLEPKPVVITESKPATTSVQPTNYKVTNTMSTAAASGIDFSDAAEKTVNAVVHVKQYGLTRRPRNLMEYLRNGGAVEKQIQGAGSGVIITADGYIVTNNHVIEGATELEVTLNNNKTYNAKIVGTAPQSDIALLKIEADEHLSYIPFGDSNSAKIGEWVLAVGNPFNLTSTVTAGIISAKSRDLNEYDGNYQSFIQTDAAVNPGNSGGALVNVRGELIGINTAITSMTGSYIGYSFAVPSNSAKKIIDDIIEYGDVQKAIIGVTTTEINQASQKEFGVNDSQGVIIAGIESDSGAEQAGLKKGDVIKQIDGVKIRKFADLSGYLSSKSPNDIVNVKIIRDGSLMTLPVKLKKYERYEIQAVGIEVVNPSKEDLRRNGVNYGVKISRTLTPRMARYNLEGIIITEIDNIKVTDVEAVKRIMAQKSPNEDISISLIDRNGEKREFVFQ